MKKIFLVSTGRTGTLSLAKTLNQIPELTATHEKFNRAREISNSLWDSKIDSVEAKTIIKESLDKVNHKNWIDCNCLLWNFIPELYEVLNNDTAFIYVYRNKKDTIKSMVRTRFYGKDKMPWEKRAQRGFIDITTDSYSDADMAENCRIGYEVRTTQIEQALNNIPTRHQLHVPFELMVSNQSAMITIYSFIYRHMGLDVDLNLKLLKETHP